MTAPARYPDLDPDYDPVVDSVTDDDDGADDLDRDQEGYFMVIPDDVVKSATQHGTVPYSAQEYDEDLEDEDDEDLVEDVLEPERKPMSRNAVSMISGIATSVVAGVIPSLFVAPPASLVSGLAAGVFGGLMGASLANEFYDRRHRD